jgi:predicted negative regulator of RcsB-dependent stress response
VKPSPSAAARGPRPLVSLCVIVKNERELLERCLASARGLVDEIIVLDTGSTDGTQAAARRCGAEVIQSTWNRDFSAARNLAIDHARGRWILVLDADEYLLDPDKQAIRNLLALHTPATGEPNRAFNLVQKSSSDGGRTGMLVHIIRLFPNRPDVRYAWPVHEQVALALQRAGVPVENTNIAIIHSGYADPARNREKQERNRAILLAQAQHGQSVTPLTFFLLAGCYLDLGDPASALEHYRTSQHLAASQQSYADVAAGAVVRIAECLVQLDRPAEAIAEMPSSFDASWHPELLNLRGRAAAALRRDDEAREWWQRVLTCADRPRIPACNLAQVKADALKSLGESWYRAGAQKRGIAILRLAREAQQAGRDSTVADLQRCYDETK